MKCPKCGKKFSKEGIFCEYCGYKLVAGKSKNITEKENNSHNNRHEHGIPHWLIPWIVFCSLLLFLAILLIPTKVLTYQVEVPYIDKEQYTVEVPYEDVEEYVAQVPYEVEEPYVESVRVEEEERIKYTADWIKCTGSGLFTNGESTVKITNTDSEGATFTVGIGYTDNSDSFISDTQSTYIGPSGSKTFTYTPMPSSASFKHCSYSLTPPTKTTVEYKDVIKTKTVTKYRDETKYRKVTKTRTETREKEVRKTKTETKQKEVNWLFGFNAIIKFRNLG